MVEEVETPSVLADYVAEDKLAKQLKTSVRSLRRWFEQRIGPRRTKIGNRSYYHRSHVAEWLEARTSQPIQRRAKQSPTR